MMGLVWGPCMTCWGNFWHRARLQWFTGYTDKRVRRFLENDPDCILLDRDARNVSIADIVDF